VRLLTKLVFLSAVAWAPVGYAGHNAASLPAGAKIYIAPMEWQMDQFLASEIRRQAVPVKLVENQEDAEYVLSGEAVKLSSHLMSPGRCFQGRLAAADGSRTVWSGEADDYATVFARLRSHGPVRAARTLVGGLRRRFFKKPR